jgi:hypothetical protein
MDPVSIEFRVDGDLPPKKDGATSMWGKPTEVRRLRRLFSSENGASYETKQTRISLQNSFGLRPTYSGRLGES